MEEELKIFTLDEANRLIPVISAQIRDLQAKREHVSALEVEIDTLELISSAPSPGGESSPAVASKVEEYTRAMSACYAAIEEIHAHGCLLKDLDTGLIDFYSLQQGRVVFLCWKIGEPEIGYWHDVGKGFSCRQPVRPEAGTK